MSKASTMRIIYIANARIPTERAHGVQIMHTCEALVQAGAKVELVVPYRFNKLKADPFDYYGVKKTFTVRRLPSIDLVALEWSGRIGFWLQEHSFAWCAVVFLFLSGLFWRGRKGEKTLIYVRGEELFSVLSSANFNRPIFLESHMMPPAMKKWLGVFKKAAGIIVINQTYEKELRQFGFQKVLCAPDGVTIADFDIATSREEARKRLNLPAGVKLALYTGHFYPWKGVDVLADAAPFLDAGTRILFVGGSPEDLDPFRAKYGKEMKILLAGLRPYKDMPLYLKAADVLVLPNTAKEAVSKWYTSPIKLFEYMASGRPIVASDLPSLREVLHDGGESNRSRDNALLVEPDNPKALAEGIMRVTQDIDLADRIAKQARLDVEKYSWKNRARLILDCINDQI